MGRKKKSNTISSYEEDLMSIASKEEEIIESYSDDYEINDDEEIIYEIDEEIEEDIEEINEKADGDYEDIPEIIAIEDAYSDEDIEEYNDEYIEDEYETYEEKPKKYVGIKKVKLIMNIIFTIIILLIVMIAVDVISVAKYDAGPFFAIPVKKYNDGGSKAYYGLGYKVIKYNQVQGRKDREIGFWNLKYNIEPVTNKDIDLAIEFYGNEQKTYEKYYKQFVRISSTLKKVDKKNHKIVIGYTDEDGKYTLEIECDIVKSQKNLADLEEGKEITIIGTVNKFKQRTKKQPNRLYIKNCFAEQ